MSSLHQLLSTLLPADPLPLPPIPSPTPLHRHLAPTIASLQLHPTLESLLHILNNDLPAAHFLLRHMEGAVPLDTSASRRSEGEPPAKVEGMHLHALLHRLEGDYANARAWYGDVAAVGGRTSFSHAWPGGRRDVEGFLEEVRGWRMRFDGAYSRAHGGEKDVANEGREEGYARLKRWHETEVRRAWEWCAERYGVGKWEDASGEFCAKGGKYRDLARGQVVGGEGWRVF